MDYFTAVRAFIRVVETGSFIKASDSLHLPRNTVTKLVQSLEAHLRIKLLNRTTRRVSPTNDGAAYYARMSRLVEEWQEVESELASAQSRPRGKLRVDMGSAMATQLVIPALPAFQARYPDLQLDIGVSDRPVDLIGDRVDCVVRGGTPSDPSLIARHIGDLPFVLCATEEYLARHGVPTHPDALEQGHKLVRYFFAGTGRQLPIELRSGTQQVTVGGNYYVSVNDANAALAAGLAGLGVLHTLAFVAQPYIEQGRLTPILEEWSAAPVPVSIIYSPNRHLSTRVRVFVDWMIELFEANPRTRVRRIGVD
jgi:LysR family transcriptional regulator for bpeEF and oprC